MIQGFITNSTFFRPFGQRLALPVELNPTGSSCVAELLFIGFPTAVLWSVVAVIIDASKSLFAWPWTHMRDKISEGITPSRTNLNPSPAVMFELLVLRVVTAVNHVVPRLILRCSGFAMSHVHRPCIISSETSATARFAVAESFSEYANTIAAGAITEPCNAVSSIQKNRSWFTLDSKKFEFFARKGLAYVH